MEQGEFEKLVFEALENLPVFFKKKLDNVEVTVEVPTPCHEIRQETKIMESYPEQVRIDLSVVDPAPGIICVQQITQKEFSGEVKVSESATVSVNLDGEKVYWTNQGQFLIKILQNYKKELSLYNSVGFIS